MISTQTETARLNLNTLCVALVNHSLLLKSGLTQYEAQCATLSAVVVQVLDASPPRVQENFGLYMQYQVVQHQQENSASLDFVANNVISMRDHIEKKNQQQQALAMLEPVTEYARSYADSELSYAIL